MPKQNEKYFDIETVRHSLATAEVQTDWISNLRDEEGLYKEIDVKHEGFRYTVRIYSQYMSMDLVRRMIDGGQRDASLIYRSAVFTATVTQCQTALTNVSFDAASFKLFYHEHRNLNATHRERCITVIEELVQAERIRRNELSPSERQELRKPVSGPISEFPYFSLRNAKTRWTITPADIFRIHHPEMCVTPFRPFALLPAPEKPQTAPDLLPRIDAQRLRAMFDSLRPEQAEQGEPWEPLTFEQIPSNKR